MLSILLTAIVMNSNVEIPFPHETVGSQTPRKGQKRPVSTLVFLCLSKSINMGLFPIKFIMVGCFEEPLIWFAGSFAGSLNLMQSTAQEFRLKAGGLFPYKGHKPMLNQNPLNNSVSNTENQLIEISNFIGSIAGRNARSTQSESSFIDKIGKPLMEITLAELMAIDKLCTDAFNAGIEPNINQVKVSPTKVMSLQKQYEIIGHALTIFCLNPNETNRAGVKYDAAGFVRMLEDLPTTPPKTSRFNVLNSTKKLIAKRVSYDQAMQYQDCIVKFAGWEYSL